MLPVPATNIQPNSSPEFPAKPCGQPRGSYRRCWSSESRGKVETTSCGDGKSLSIRKALPMRTILTRLGCQRRLWAVLCAGLVAGGISGTSGSDAEEPAAKGKAAIKAKKLGLDLPSGKKK